MALRNPLPIYEDKVSGNPSEARCAVKILYVGPLWLGSNALSLANGFRADGHHLTVVDTTQVNRLTRFSPDWAYAKLTGERRRATRLRVEHQIESLSKTHVFDVLFCYKTIHLNQLAILSTRPKIKIHYSADDVSNAHNVTSDYLKQESLWDRIITTKKHNVEEISRRGGRPHYVMSAYDPAWHYPQVSSSNSNHTIGFVGNSRPDRVGLIRDLARRYGSDMLVAGEGWATDLQLRRSGVQVRKAAYGPDYSRMLSGIGINLVLLNSDNRDTHTCRSFEVPASGGLFVGPRTDEHSKMLEEGSEALFYSSYEELNAVLQQLEGDKGKIEQLAAAGSKRIRSARATYQDRAAEIVANFE